MEYLKRGSNYLLGTYFPICMTPKEKEIFWIKHKIYCDKKIEEEEEYIEKRKNEGTYDSYKYLIDERMKFLIAYRDDLPRSKNARKLLETYPNYVDYVRKQDGMSIIRDIMICNYYGNMSNNCNILRMEAQAQGFNPFYNGLANFI